MKQELLTMLALDIQSIKLCFKKDIPYNCGKAQGSIDMLILLGLISIEEIDYQQDLILLTTKQAVNA